MKKHTECKEIKMVFWLPEIAKALMACGECHKHFLTECNEIQENG